MGIELIFKIVLAAALSALIDLEKVYSGQEPRFKVNILVATGSTLLTGLSIQFTRSIPGHEAKLLFTPFLAGTIVAIGVFGAAAMFRDKIFPLGLASAASIWISGAIGVIVGAGYYYNALAAALIIVALLFLVQKISGTIERQKKVCVYIISTNDNASVVIDIKRTMMEMGIKFANPNVRKNKDGYEIVMAISTSHTKNKAVVERIMHLPDVKEITIENLE